MSSQETAYKYTVPLEDDGGIERPAYSTAGPGETVYVSVQPHTKVVVSSKSIPHLHKDSVNVQVEEVPLSSYASVDESGDDA